MACNRYHVCSIPSKPALQAAVSLFVHLEIAAPAALLPVPKPRGLRALGPAHLVRPGWLGLGLRCLGRGAAVSGGRAAVGRARRRAGPLTCCSLSASATLDSTGAAPSGVRSAASSRASSASVFCCSALVNGSAAAGVSLPRPADAVDMREPECMTLVQLAAKGCSRVWPERQREAAANMLLCARDRRSDPRGQS